LGGATVGDGATVAQSSGRVCLKAHDALMERTLSKNGLQVPRPKRKPHLSFPKIISARSDDAIRTRLV